MQPKLFESLLCNAKFTCMGLDPSERCACRLFHDVAELSGEDQLFTTLHDADLNSDHVATNWRDHKAGRRTDLVIQVHLAVLVPLWPKPCSELLQVNAPLTNLLLSHTAGNLAHQRGDLSLRIAHASFACVVANQVHHRLVWDGYLTLLEAVIFPLLRNDVTLGDLQLLRFGVARDLDDLHTITERVRNRVQLVCRCNEEHLREIKLHLQIVVLEGCVLLGIEHFKQGG